jgi:hypothetical protein
MKKQKNVIPPEMLLDLEQFENREFRTTIGRVTIGNTSVSLMMRTKWTKNGDRETINYEVCDLTQPKGSQIVCFTQTVQEGIDYLNAFVEEREGNNK